MVCRSEPPIFGGRNLLLRDWELLSPYSGELQREHTRRHDLLRSCAAVRGNIASQSFFCSILFLGLYLF